MRRLPTHLVLFLALLALLVPSVAIGGRGFAPSPESTYVRTVEGGYLRAPCVLKAGKHVSCPRPDSGVIPVATPARFARDAGMALHLADIDSTGRTILPALPPPRLG